MKTKLSLLLLLVGITFGCQKEEITHVTAVKEKLQAAEDVSRQIAQMTFKIIKAQRSSVSIVQRINTEVTMQQLNTEIKKVYGFNGIEYSNLSKNSSAIRNLNARKYQVLAPEDGGGGGNTPPEDEILIESFSDVQGLTPVSDNYVAELSGRIQSYGENDIDVAIADLEADKNVVLSQSTYSNDDFIKLTIINNSLESLAYIKSDNFEGQYPTLEASISMSLGKVPHAVAQRQGCKVSWRSVWAGGVIGFAVGGVAGAKVGCAGGTVIFPGLGTAGGCVGGAVLGAATGFIGGVLTGIAAELLTSCGR